MNSGDQITVDMRLAAIEEKLDRLLTYLGLTDDAGFAAVPPATIADHAAGLTGAQWESVVTLIRSEKKIQAIKAYREATGVGLKVAKDAVDAIERNLRANGGWR